MTLGDRVEIEIKAFHVGYIYLWRHRPSPLTQTMLMMMVMVVFVVMLSMVLCPMLFALDPCYQLTFPYFPYSLN